MGMREYLLQMFTHFYKGLMTHSEIERLVDDEMRARLHLKKNVVSCYRLNSPALIYS